VERGQEVAHSVQVETSRDDIAPAAVLGDVAIGLVLVADLADDDLQQVLHGG